MRLISSISSSRDTYLAGKVTTFNLVCVCVCVGGVHASMCVPMTELVCSLPMKRVRRQTSEAQLCYDEWEVRTHETLCKDQLSENVLIHQFNGHA